MQFNMYNRMSQTVRGKIVLPIEKRIPSFFQFDVNIRNLKYYCDRMRITPANFKVYK